MLTMDVLVGTTLLNQFAGLCQFVSAEPVQRACVWALSAAASSTKAVNKMSFFTFSPLLNLGF